MDVYDAPSADLELTNKPLTAAEKLALSRREMAEASARSRLNFVWGFRLLVDLLMLVMFILAVIGVVFGGEPLSDDLMIGLGAILVLFVAEIIFIVAYFRKKAWCVWPLHIYSAISLINIPFGTILSLIHFFSMPKVRFNAS